MTMDPSKGKRSFRSWMMEKSLMKVKEKFTRYASMQLKMSTMNGGSRRSSVTAQCPYTSECTGTPFTWMSSPSFLDNQGLK